MGLKEWWSYIRLGKGKTPFATYEQQLMAEMDENERLRNERKEIRSVIRSGDTGHLVGGKPKPLRDVWINWRGKNKK